MQITVFTPTYNRAHLLPRLYKSLCAQTCKDFEWVIVDDGSVDDTKSIIDGFINDNSITIRYFCQENGGKHRAINRGVKEAKGNLFFIADSDDTLPEKSIETVLNQYEKAKNLTPLGGVMMGTRTGDIDPSVFNYLVTCTGKSAEQIYQEFNKESGLLGVSGVSNDTRDIEAGAANGNERCVLAMKMFANRIASFIGSYFIKLGHVDAIVFSAGIGENAPEYREAIIDDCKEAMKLELDKEANKVTRFGKEGIISTPSSSCPIIVVPTDEELMIARDTVRLLKL